MRVLITGGTGLIGSTLAHLLAPQGYEVIILSRYPKQAAQLFSQQGLPQIQTIGWDATSAQGWGELLTNECAIVNLAGATPAHWRWTRTYRARILESRLSAGQAVIQAMDHYGPPAVLIQASASGYYGDRGQELLTETSLPGQGFRARVCQEWEASTASAPTRRCIVRTGLVLDLHAGAFPPLVQFARVLGSQVGNGHQWLPWIHRMDVARAIQFLLEQRQLSGPFNLCAPEGATNRAFLRAVQDVLRRPPLFPLPAFVLRAALGELATVMLDSQHLVPEHLTEATFQFAYPTLSQALYQLLRERGGSPVAKRKVYV
ncbi:NAD-dependent dehydratase [Ktedonobacter sp. SOSP1-85]|uniref:TIGR01777 family oxidoreductase n=1 Tax=Ktedonobacter sp. SOSP1-85 TaxID=2778367 RepID=UPI0019152F37|nr:TIGR01777 family oxidoreductase [Ktedonobacter sp. SOSP1-85]GHO72330.1 NAD-dependent dehydratase [Ktedonobacter sp. SOSP1-85]